MDKDLIEVKIKEIGTFSLEKGESVLSMLRKKGLVNFTNCGGKGTCGRCRIRFTKGATLPMPGDRRMFSPEELRDNVRLACLAKPQVNCEIELLFSKSNEFILTKSVININRKSNSSSSYSEKCMIVTDIGTTTIVMQLLEINTGRILDTYTEMNSQRRYGADVISRMQHAMAGDADELSFLVETTLLNGINKWIYDYPIELMIIACNTVMSHLLLKFDVTSMSHAPFKPFTLDSIETKFNSIHTVVLPAISAFVGGDIVAGILACENQMKVNHISKSLLIDLGTNGEIALIGPDKIICTATAAGPAFEGGATVSIPGSDVIAAVYELIQNKVINHEGLLSEPYFEKGVTVSGIHLIQQDIRNLQVAKAAVFAGIQVLLKNYDINVEEIDNVYLAGGFGYKLNVQAAVHIGLLPLQLESKTVAVGNTVLVGAYLFGLSYLDKIPEIDHGRLKNVESINLAEQKDFNDIYINALMLKEKEI